MATFEFKLPEMGEGVMEGEIFKWLVKEGDAVSEDQPLVEVMTDKAVVTVPSPRKGKVLKCHGLEGEKARVNTPLVLLELDGEAPALAAAAHASNGKVKEPEPAAAATAAAKQSNGKVLATPVTRKMARELGLDLANIAGSGVQGRVTKADLVAAAEHPSQQNYLPPEQRGVAPVDQRVPLRGLRRKIAEKMVRSKSHAPHSTFVEEVDATLLVALRSRLNAALAEGERISFLPFICKAVMRALKKFPQFNATFDEAREELVIRGTYHFGIATATEDGLTVPVVKSVDTLSFLQLSSEIARLSTAARERRLKLEELSGGSFTLTSLGQRGGLFATPILNHPEVAILGVHRIKKQPVVKGNDIVIREIGHLSLSFDHRVIDGAVAANFTYEIIKYLEQPELLMLELR